MLGLNMILAIQKTFYGIVFLHLCLFFLKETS